MGAWADDCTVWPQANKGPGKRNAWVCGYMGVGLVKVERLREHGARGVQMGRGQGAWRGAADGAWGRWSLWSGCTYCPYHQFRGRKAGRATCWEGRRVSSQEGRLWVGGTCCFYCHVLTRCPAPATPASQVSVGLRPSEALQWSFLNTAVRTADSRRGVAAAANLALAVAGGGGGGGHPQVAVWMMESGRGDRRQHVVQL